MAPSPERPCGDPGVSATSGYHGFVNSTPARRIAAILTALATAVVIVAVAILPFLTPAWVDFDQGWTGAIGYTGYTHDELRSATNSILADLVIGPPDFDVAVRGEPVLNERERGHMRDVRSVFAGFAVLALLAAVFLVAAIVGARRLGHPERAWTAVRNGARGLAAGVVIAGVIAYFAFDAAFEAFHRLFFPGGTYTFDPRTDRLVQLFPFDFWSQTTMAVGVVILVLTFVVARFAGGRVRGATVRAEAPRVAASEAIG
jgi:integral membrane protein (TIGR01906 family)